MVGRRYGALPLDASHGAALASAARAMATSGRRYGCRMAVANVVSECWSWPEKDQATFWRPA